MTYPATVTVLNLFSRNRGLYIGTYGEVHACMHVFMITTHDIVFIINIYSNIIVRLYILLYTAHTIARLRIIPTSCMTCMFYIISAAV